MRTGRRPPEAEVAAGVERLWVAHVSRVYGYARRHNPADRAEDVVSETFIVAWRRFDVIPDDPLPWLLGVARNVGRSLARADAHRSGAPPVEAVPDFVDAINMTQDLRVALLSLSAADREILYLLAWEDLTVKSAAAVIGCTTAAAKVRAHRARARLLERLPSDLDRTVSSRRVRGEES